MFCHQLVENIHPNALLLLIKLKNNAFIQALELAEKEHGLTTNGAENISVIWGKQI